MENEPLATKHDLMFAYIRQLREPATSEQIEAKSALMCRNYQHCIDYRDSDDQYLKTIGIIAQIPGATSEQLPGLVMAAEDSIKVLRNSVDGLEPDEYIPANRRFWQRFT